MNDDHAATAQENAADAAAHWCMRLHEPDCSEAERRAFARWLAADPLHAVEYQAMLEIWQVAAQLPRTPAPSVAARPVRRRAWRQYGIAAALSLLAIPLAGLAGWELNWLPNAYQRFEADGEVRHVTLADGSQVELNLGTRLTYANYKDQRRVTLEKGEAFFEVTHSLEHPFVVRAADGQVRVTGTAFNVWMYRDQVRVTLLKGSVVVTSHDDTEGYRLDPGMQASYKAGDFEPQIQQTYAADTSLAWRQGKLVLDNLPLSDALPLINRYLDTPVLLADASTGAIRIGGIYNTAQVKNLVSSLPKVLPIVVSQNKAGHTVLSAAPRTPAKG